ncbi:MAG: hypothetical protein R3C14_32180 [Caldilineaceae bacterium]
MYYFAKWDMLIVDDEPDVLTLSELAMEDFEVYGLPLVLHTAQTKTEAIELLEETPDLAMNLALAFVDVVMETDDAGLKLCNYIREDIGNRLTQIFIRTGQPGLAPEKTVIDHYEINGYFTKLDTTEEKLYSLVKSGIRQFLWSHMAQTYMAGINEVLNAPDWQPKIEQVLRSFVEPMPGAPVDIPLYIAFDQRPLVQAKLDAQQAAKWQEEQSQAKVIQFTRSGNLYARDDTNLWGINIVASPTNAEVQLLCRTAFAPPQDLVMMTYEFLKSLATLWQRQAVLLSEGRDP